MSFLFLYIPMQGPLICEIIQAWHQTVASTTQQELNYRRQNVMNTGESSGCSYIIVKQINIALSSPIDSFIAQCVNDLNIHSTYAL